MLHQVRFQSCPPMVTSMAPAKAQRDVDVDSPSMMVRYWGGQKSPSAQRSVA